MISLEIRILNYSQGSIGIEILRTQINRKIIFVVLADLTFEWRNLV